MTLDQQDALYREGIALMEVSLRGEGGRWPQEFIMRHFAYLHLEPKQRAIAALYADLAKAVVLSIEPAEERTVALRKLLESRDAALRAA